MVDWEEVVNEEGVADELNLVVVKEELVDDAIEDDLSGIESWDFAFGKGMSNMNMILFLVSRTLFKTSSLFMKQGK